jgi:hypothetical protein
LASKTVTRLGWLSQSPSNATAQIKDGRNLRHVKNKKPDASERKSC